MEPKVCCSTSRSATSTPSCARKCAFELRRLVKAMGITTIFVTHEHE